jgi:peptidyl-prolyl cis-trans isomerase C
MSTPRPSSARWILAAGLALFAAAWEGGAVHADVSPVVARVGTQAITAADLERRMAAVPPFQLRSFGATPAEIRKSFLERVLVREALLAQGGEDRGLMDRPEVRDKIRGVLRSARLARLRAEVGKPKDEDVKAYYEKNAAKFHSPARIAIWQIAVAKREEAEAILADLKKDPTPKRWTELARDKSIDKATAMRGGNLGFVAPDGTTAEPGLRVSKAVLEAAEKVKDSELVPEPVKDGDRWAVVWRRQGMKAIDRPLELEAGAIKQILLHERTEAKIKETVAELRKQSLTEHAPELLEAIDITPQGDLTPVRRPGALPQIKRAPVNPVPAPGTNR